MTAHRAHQQMTEQRTLRARALALAVVTALGLSGCGLIGGDEGAAESGAEEVTVENCGAEVTIPQDPQRVVMLKSAAVPYLAELGVLDQVVSRAGAYPREYYDDQTWAQLEQIPSMTDELDPSGHLQISREEVVGQEPDLVLGEIENLNRETLAASDIPMLEEPVLCASGAATSASFADISEQMQMYGQVFDRGEEAEAAIEDLEADVAAIQEEAGEPDGRTAAMLYPTIGGGTTYAYGNASMADPQLEAAGFENVFGDVDERVFEVTLEELLGQDPDVIVLLYSEGEPEQVREALTSLPGAGDLSAVSEGDVMTQLFNFTEPPTPLSIEGTRAILEQFPPGEDDQ